ncbi:MAG: RICIN domain-containing protein [Bacteroidaceae bacterium]|nr:RICIN domain-containing protein [Bacteroidaceae bacterium]
MKNTMKIKSLLSFFVPAAMMSLMVASCSDYDNGYTEKAIKFTEDFRKAYGDIDPEQDWNLAERGTVTVSTQKESEVKIYVFSGGDYYLVGDYQGVKNTQVLGFDMVEGTSSILVTDGETAQKTVPGGVVAFGGTRTTYPGNDVVTINKIENDKGLYLETTGKTYPKYVEFNSMDDYSKIFKTVPEIGWKEIRDKTNLNKVPSNFHYTSNGSFIIYPIYWNTSSLNTLGVYYRNGDQIVKVPVYKHKEGNEVQYATANQRVEANWSGANPTANAAFNQEQKILTWSQNNYNQVGGLFTKANLSSYKYLTINASIKSGNEYRVYFRKENNENGQKQVTVNQSGSVTIDLSTVPNEILTDCEILLSGSGTTSSGEVQFTSMYLWSDNVTWHDFEGTDDEAHQRCDAIFEQGDGKFNGVKMRAQGIKVDIPEGTVFGMYLEKTENAGTANAKTYTFYSESELNDPDEVGFGVIDDDHGNVTQVTDKENPKSHPCYASAFDVDGLHYLGFEDWPNAPYNNSDFDLNDMIFAFDGCKPTVIVEEPDKAEWLLVCEDLGGSFDTDYNDVVFKVEHVSGREYANVTAMAAGGTLASYICFCDPTQGAASHDDIVIGEIHQMFDAAPEESGAYTPINAYSRFDKTGHSVTIPVDKNWQIAYNVDADQYTAAALSLTGDEKGANMGGFYVLTLPAGTPVPSANPTIGNLGNNASRIAAPGPGAAPYIICLPYTYEVEEGENINKYVWAWPQELCTICSATYENGKYKGTNGGAYSEFASWVGDYTTHKDWYKHKTNDMTVEQWLVSSKNKNNGQVKQPSNLNNIGPWTVGSGNQINLLDNLVNFSLGELHYEFNGNSVSGSTFQVPTQPGTYTVNVTQDADQDYLAGSTTITLIVPRKVAEYKFTVKSASHNNNTNTNLALAVDGGALKLKTIASSDNQTWIAEDAGDGKVYLRNKGTNQYLGCNGSNSWTATFSNNPVTNARGRFTIQDLSGGKTIIVERNGDRGLKADNIVDGDIIYLNSMWGNTDTRDKYIIWGVPKQPSPLTVKQQTVTWTVGQEFDMSSNITTSSNGAITYNKYHFAGNESIGEGDYDIGMNGNKLTPGQVGTHTISITQAETDDYYGATVTYVLNVVAANSNTGAQTFNVPGTISSAAFTIENGSENGKYNVKYNGEPVLNNVTSITFRWSDVKVGDAYANSITICSPSSTVFYSTNTNRAGKQNVPLNIEWGNGESHQITITSNNYGDFTLEVDNIVD